MQLWSIYNHGINSYGPIDVSQCDRAVVACLYSDGLSSYGLYRYMAYIAVAYVVMAYIVVA